MPALGPPPEAMTWNTGDVSHAGCRAESRMPRHGGTWEYWGPFRVCYERPMASKPTEPTEGLNFLPLHLQPLALIPNPDNLTSHHQSAGKQGLLSLKAWG